MMIRCKGFCEGFSKEKVTKRLPFLKFSRCRTCAIWIKNKDVLDKVRCPCCHGRVATRPRLNSHKRKYIPLRLAK